MKIAILGAGGFLGSKLCKLLAADGHQVFGFVLNAGHNKVRGVQFNSVHDLISTSNQNASFYDLVINLAARRSTRLAQYSDAEVDKFTYQVPKEFIRRTVGPNTNVINVSTYIQNFGGVPSRTVDSYGAAKEKLSQYLEGESLVNGLRVRDLFFFTLYGVGDRPNHLVPLLLDAAKNRKALELSPGDQLINLLYLDDAAQNILNCLSLSSELGYEKNYVWEKDYLTVKQLVSEIEKIIDVRINCLWGSRSYVGHEMFEPWPVPMRQLPSFFSTVALEEGIRRIWKSLG